MQQQQQCYAMPRHAIISGTLREVQSASQQSRRQIDKHSAIPAILQQAPTSWGIRAECQMVLMSIEWFTKQDSLSPSSF